MDEKISITLIAAGFTFLGALLSQCVVILLYYFEIIHKRRILFRDKYEQLMFHFQDSLKFYKDINKCKNIEELLLYEISEASQRTMGLALLYFPEFIQNIESYIKVQLKFYDHAITSFNPQIPASVGAQIRKHNEDKTIQIEKELFYIKNKILDDFKKYANKYTMS